MSPAISATLKTDWFGAAVSGEPTFDLRLDAGVITLRARVAKPPLLVPGDAGAYTSGLWEGDCAELFLANPATGRYLEINLSPKGGWWSCEFTAPRVRAPGAPAAIAGVTTSATLAGDRWEAEIRIPVASLPAALAFAPGDTRGNVTFCLGHAPQRYLTYADLGGGAPDFHRPAAWPVLFA